MAKIFKFARNFVLAVAGFVLLIIAIGTAQAAGALAVGVCGAYGYGFDYSKVTEARAAAMQKCSGGQCKVVGVVRRGCAAMAVDAQEPLRLVRLGDQFASRQSRECFDAALL